MDARNSLLDAWTGPYRYMGRLAETRAGFKGDGKYQGPFAPVTKALLTARFLLRSRAQRALEVRRLARARGAPVKRKSEPLVSVVLTTHNRCDLLMERAMPSVLDQTYRNIELVIVGDRCTDDTERRIKDLGSPNVRFNNLPETGRRLPTGYDRWLMVSIDPCNMGLAMSRGEWIVHLDDDDQLVPRHTETLLKYALENDLEMVYTKFLWDSGLDEPAVMGSFPPEPGTIGHSGVLYSSRLKFFRYDRNAWKYLEPGDWNLWRRMKEAGVRIGFIDEVLVINYPAGPGHYAAERPG